MRTAVIAGATGLVGGELVQMLLQDGTYSRVIALTRREFPVDHPKLRKVITDLHQIPAALSGIEVDDVFCCLGTTMAKAGSREKFREVDFVFPLALAEATHALGASQYMLVSALGAKKDSFMYYNRVKGEVEQALRGVGFKALHIFRPSLLLGARTERRPGEGAAKILFRIFGGIIPAKYKGVEARAVAKAMVGCALMNKKGVHIHESKEIQDRWGHDA